MAKTQIHSRQIRQITSADAATLFADGAIAIAKLATSATQAELNFLSGVTSSIQSQINAKLNASALKKSGEVTWTDDSVTATAAAIAALVTQKIGEAQIDGVMSFKGNWSASPTPTTAAPIKKGHTFVYNSGTAPTGLTLEAGDMLVCVADITTSAGKTTASNWSVVQSNISGAVTTISAALTSGTLLVGAGGKTISVSNFTGLLAATNGIPRAATSDDLPAHLHNIRFNDGKTNLTLQTGEILNLSAVGGGVIDLLQEEETRTLRITFPAIPDIVVSGGTEETDKYISAVSASGHTISVTKKPLPTIPQAAGIVTKTDQSVAGTKNGTNKVFTIAENVVATSVQLFLNGMKLTRGSDYTLSGTGNKTITFADDSYIPLATDEVTISYITA
jgi:hypothetical protein